MKSRDGDRDPGKPSSAPGLRWTRRGGLLERLRKALDGNSNGQAKPEAPLTVSRKNSELATEGESNPPGGEIISGRLYKRARYRHKCVESDGNSSRKRSVQQDSVPKVTTPSGLENLGNTCYLNAILQCLRSTNLVRDYCCSIEPICPKCSKLNGDLFPAFVYLITKMDSITNGSVGSSTLSKFKNAFAKFVPSYGGNLQQDALEFFTYLMDGLHEEIKERPLTPTHSGVNYVRSVSIGSSLPPTIPPSKRKLSHKPQMGGLKVSESSHQLATADTGELGDRTKPLTRKWSRPWLQRSRAPSAGHVNNPRCGGYICQLALGSAETTAGGKSFLKDTFVGHLQTQLRCLQCNNVNTRDELFWNLALCVPEANKEETRKGASPSSPTEASPPDDTGVSLDDCLRAFTKPEILDDLDKPFCGKCKAPTKAQLQVMISRLPKILVLQFQRFDSTCCKTKKRHLIKFDFQQDMAPYYVKDSPGEETLSSAEKTPEVDSPQTVNPPRSSLTSSTTTIDVTGAVVSTNYRLYAVVFHQGGTERGHYTARCFLPSPQPAWFLFDDENVSPIVDPHDVIQPTAYILFYERVDAPDNAVSTSSVLDIFLCLWLFIWIIFVFALLLRRHLLRENLAKQHKMSNPPVLLSLFHPYCNSGGGGERVLWTGVNILLHQYPRLFIFIYTNDSDCLSAPSRAFQNIQTTFDITVEAKERVHFIPLRSEFLLRPSLYPCLTLAGQAFGSVVAAFEALIRLPPDFYLDTSGFTFTIPLFAWLLGANCGAYVHFPIVSSDMQRRVAERIADSATSYNNLERIRRSAILTRLKRVYYALFQLVYGWAGSATNCRIVAVNSTWTQRHIMALFGTRPYLLYPPCPCKVERVENNDRRKPWILSIGQFRPEKNHMLQLRAFELFLRKIPGDKSPYRLILIGGCRDGDDYSRVRRLKESAKRMGLSDRQVIFEVNVPVSKVRQYLSEATINLHTMVDEHFGIGIVEGMAAGLVTVANRSGGPLMDIIGPALAHLRADVNKIKPTPVGYLAARDDEYAEIFHYVLLEALPSQLQPLRVAAKKRAQALFSEEAFCKGWLTFAQKLGL